MLHQGIPPSESALTSHTENLAWLLTTRDQLVTCRVLCVRATDVGNVNNRDGHGSPELIGFSLRQKEGHGPVNTANPLTSFGSNYTGRKACAIGDC